METQNLLICQCSSCQKVWKVFEGKKERMIRYKENGPDTFEENLLCPVCWRVLQPDYKIWAIVCTDPTCGYSKRIPGLSRDQEQIKSKYLDLKHQVFACAQEGEIPPEVLEEYTKLKLEFEEVKRYDHVPKPLEIPIVD